MKPAFYIKRFVRKLRDDQSGFSLLEIIIATALSSMILLMVYSAHRSIMSAIYDITGVADFYESVNLAIEKIEKDLSYAYYNRYNTKLSFIGENQQGTVSQGRLNFVSVDHEPYVISVTPRLPNRHTDINEVGYYLAADKKTVGLYELMRRQDTGYDDKPEEGGFSDVLLYNVVDLRFEFWLRNDWVDKWNSKETSKIPSAVKTILKIKNYRGNIETFTLITFVTAGTGAMQ